MITGEYTKNGKPKPREVEPVKNLKDIKKIKQYLLGKPDKREYCIFVVGINIGLRAGDLLNLKIRDVSYVKSGRVTIVDGVSITEQKTRNSRKSNNVNKQRVFEFNDSAKKALELYIASLPDYIPDNYLFRSNKSKKNDNKPLTVRSLHKLIKGLLRELNISGNYGTHSLRKSFGYHIFINHVKEDPGILQVLMKIFGHSSEAMTVKYIGITKDVISNVYQKLNL